MRMTGHPIEPEELMAYLDGELPAHQAAATESHLEKCQECQRAADDLRHVSARLSDWTVEQSVLETPALPENRKKPPLLGKWPWVWAAAALSIALLIFVPWGGRQKAVSVDQVRARNPLSIALDDFGSGAARFDLEADSSRAIVRGAQLTVAVKEVDTARSSLDVILKRHGGYISQLAMQGQVLQAVLRVPADQLEAAMADLKQLGHVDSESQTGEEVTQQVVDLEARLANAQNSEQRLTELLRQRTGKLSDVLAVEKEIERVRGDIERMEAERKNLANRVDFATVNVKLLENSHAALPGFRNAAVVGYRTLLESLTGVALFLLANGPAVLFWSIVLFFPCRWLWRRSRRRLLHSL